MTPANVIAVITAAGRSTRMGRPKALLEWGGRPLITHQVDVLGACREIIVVLGHEPGPIRPFVPVNYRVRVMENPDYDLGRTSTLKLAFSAIRGTPDGILVVAVDQPLSKAIVAQVLHAARPESPVVVPSYGGRSGHPVLFRGDLLPELQAIEDKTLGLRGVVERHRDQRQLVEIPDPDVLLDLNMPADYESRPESGTDRLRWPLPIE